jgi:hypothetical protein
MTETIKPTHPASFDNPLGQFVPADALVRYLTDQVDADISAIILTELTDLKVDAALATLAFTISSILQQAHSDDEDRACKKHHSLARFGHATLHGCFAAAEAELFDEED